MGNGWVRGCLYNKQPLYFPAYLKFKKKEIKLFL